MNITLEQIKSLRDRTSVSTMACKEALVEAGGDEEKAIEILRKKGAAKAAKRSDRTTAHGTVAIVHEGGKAAMLSLACETDFVAKNDDFMSKAEELTKKLLEGGEDTDISAEVTELVLQMGEKIEIHEKKVLEAGNVGVYKHLNNRIGVLVSMSGGDAQLGQDIAMHIAAMSPKNLSPTDISDEDVEKEKGIWKEQLIEEGKPEAIIDKIMMGKEDKFRKESALLSQPFVKNPEQLIQDLLGDITIAEFWRFEV